MSSFDLVKIKYVADLYTGNSIPDNEKENFKDKLYPYVSTKDIGYSTGIVNYQNGMSVDDKDGFKLAYPCDTLLCIEGGSAGKKIAFVEEKIAFVNKLCCLHPDKIESRFLYYSLQSPLFLDYFFLNMTGLIGGVNLNTLKNLFITKPPMDVQVKIADIIQNKINKIDTLIDNQQQQIEKLKEYKQSLISEVVTKGLDPNVEFKDSGIDWIGKIPVHWNIVPLKYSSNITMGQSPKSESYNTEQVGKPFLGGNSDITDGFSSPKYYTTEITKTCKKGDILMSVRAPVGTIAKSLHDAVLGRGLCSIKSKISNDFTYFYMCFLENKWNEYITGTTFDSVNADDIKNMPYVLAPADEILHLLEYMNNKIKLIDRLIKIMVDKVVCLNDYKKSLIYEYVTGKKEVS